MLTLLRLTFGCTTSILGCNIHKNAYYLIKAKMQLDRQMEYRQEIEERLYRSYKANGGKDSFPDWRSNLYTYLQDKPNWIPIVGNNLSVLIPMD